MNDATISNFVSPRLADMSTDMASRVSYTERDKAELKKAAQEFEAVFIGQLLKVMRETIEESGMEGGGLGKGVYTELFDQEIALSMAQRGALGIGDLIYRSLVDRENGGAVPPSLSETMPSPQALPRAARTGGQAQGREAAPAASPEGSNIESHSHAEPEDPCATPAAAPGMPEISDMLLPVHAPISSAFGMRKDPFTGAARFHKGVDIAAPAGTPVVAALSGRVVAAGREGGYGNTVVVEHGDGLRTRYGHLASIDVKVGDVVASGDALGTVGSTGRSTGSHLHFEVTRMGEPANPLVSLNAK